MTVTSSLLGSLRVTRHLVAPVVAALLLVSRAAAADDKQACFTRFVDVQAMRHDGSLRAAREAAAACSRASCPSAVSADCLTWMRELDASIPTVVVSATDRAGQIRLDAVVTMDGVPFPQGDGRARPVDPGTHLVRCAIPGEQAVDVRVVVLEGQHDVPLRCEIPPARAASPPSVDSRPLPTSRPVPWEVYALGSAAVVATGVWGYFGASAFFGSPNVGTCSPACSPHDHDLVHERLVAADIAGGLALVGGGSALAWYLLRPTQNASLAGGFRLLPGPHGLVAGYQLEL